jgi:SAM-dependent methyltransferase
MTLVELPRVIPNRPGRPEWGEAAAPMRELTRAIAMEPDAWTPERATRIAAFFDSQAAAWSERDAPERHEALVDALARGGTFPNRRCLEIGSGTGNATGDLRATFREVISLDLSREMLARTAKPGRQIQADAARVPLRDGSASVVALINMFLFPLEVARVLAEDAVLLWVSTNGDETPIYLPPREVLDALPGTWDGITAQAGWGTWLTARRRA